ncbi:MAG: hypothetical protein JSW58_10305 [Candidatus Latescibacterota bacterium]|nr:MAG: hypothetical protein JSW58_10305 [Candidatus Latescibacterota bacterium]
MSVRRFVAVGFLGLILAAEMAVGMTSRSKPVAYPHYLVFVQRNLEKDKHVEEIRDIVERASRHGYNGIVLSGSFDRIALKSPKYLERLRAVKRICDGHQMDLIPDIFSVGYAGGILAHDRNLAAAVPVKNVPLVVRGGETVLQKDPDLHLRNGGLESRRGDKALGFGFQDLPGKVSFVDGNVFRGGNLSLRFENFTESRGGMARVMQDVAVRPFRCYRLSLWVKTEDLDPPKSFQIAAMTNDKRMLMFWLPLTEATEDWREVTIAFNSLTYDNVTILAGVWRGREGRVWIDDMRLGEVGFLNVLHRSGTPMVVKDRNTGVVYREGEDFEPVKDAVLSFKPDHPEPALKIRPGGRIREGDELVVDYYQALALKVGVGQMGVCMSDPKTHEIWSDIVKKVHEQIAPDYYWFSMSEIRQGGWCVDCERRGLSAGQLLGDCVTRQVELVRSVNPNAEIFVWSDMLDPHHNARAGFHLFNGNLDGSWKYIPKDVIIACWKYDIRKKSLRHFDELGFRTIGCGYYDKRSVDDAGEWLKSLAKTPGACGIMYTTWISDYDFLEAFGEVVIEGGTEGEKPE